MNLIPHSRPWLTNEDFRAVNKVLESGMIAQGEKTGDFERVVAGWVGLDQPGVAVGSGSAAVVLALRALRLGPGDDVVLPSYVCASLLQAVRTVGANPILSDVSADWIVTPQQIEAVLTPRTKALIIPHLYGIFADVASFRRFSVPIVEDFAQAVPGQGDRRLAGEIGIFSFHPTKCLTTGEGGMAVTADAQMLCTMRELRDGPDQSDGERFFSPLSDVAAALGLSQLTRYPISLRRRKKIAESYFNALAEIIPSALEPVSRLETVYFRFPLRLEGGLDAYEESFAQEGIIVRRGVDQLLHRLAGLSDEGFPITCRLFESTISLPIYPALTQEEQDHCVAAAVRIFSSAGAGASSAGRQTTEPRTRIAGGSRASL